MERAVPGQTNPNFMAGVPELMILRLLKAREMYGYEIVAAIRDESGQVLCVGEGVIYPVLHGLEKDGALKSRRKTVGGRSRVYYSVTPKGLKRFETLASDWSRLAGAIQAVLTGGAHVPAI